MVTLENDSLLLRSCQRTSMKEKEVSDRLPAIPHEHSGCSTRSGSRPSSSGSESKSSMTTASISVNTKRFLEACERVREPRPSKTQLSRRSSSAANRSSVPSSKRSSSTRMSSGTAAPPVRKQPPLHDVFPWLSKTNVAAQETVAQERFEKELLELSLTAGVSPPRAGTSQDPLITRSPSSPELGRSGRSAKLRSLRPLRLS